ncbi:MAG: TIGR00730 family Rossman fold protein [Chloroflexota bacterium]
MRICVFCGASPGNEARYVDAARGLGQALAAQGIGVVYGGGRVGLMGALADATLAAGGEVIGVIPQGLVDRELAHPGLSELRIVDTLHERKAEMADLADAFIALPGGLGTLEELSEVVSWAQLELHSKPIGLLDVGDYWSLLLAWLDMAVAEGFVAPAHRRLVIRSDSLAGLLDAFQRWRPPPGRWDVGP